jgi:H+/Cl- antiporter ClcA
LPLDFLKSPYRLLRPVLRPMLKAEQTPTVLFLLRWLAICSVVGILAGSASALFIVTLAWVTHYREAHPAIIAGLPLAGLAIGATYHYLGRDAARGNNLLLDEIHSPHGVISPRIVPLVLGSTLLTHLFGGSVGREGTAVQMGGALSDQLTRIFKVSARDRRLLLIAGISAGFASVFGTPVAGAVFGIEVVVIGAVSYDALIPSVLAAVSAAWVTKAWGIHYEVFPVLEAPPFDPSRLLLTVVCGALFGLAARSFAVLTHWVGHQFQRVPWPPLRPVIGGLLITAGVLALGTQYIGLGDATILAAAKVPQAPYVFLLKMAFTALTLGCGFKGGEVTPLFFIGATLGSALSTVVPLPLALLASMGFIAILAGAANTPIACTLLGVELFGSHAGAYFLVACVVAYLTSGHQGIYSSQVIGAAKHVRFGREQGHRLDEVAERRKGKH